MSKGIFFGGEVTRWLPPAVLRYLSGSLFLAAGFWVLLRG